MCEIPNQNIENLDWEILEHEVVRPSIHKLSAPFECEKIRKFSIVIDRFPSTVVFTH